MGKLAKILAALGAVALGSAAAYKLSKRAASANEEAETNNSALEKKEFMGAISYQAVDCIALVDHEVEELFNREHLEQIMSREDYAKLKRIVLAGAGDSWNCAALISEILPELVCVDFEAWDPIKATRYIDADRLMLGNDPADMLGVGITAGGGTARVAEWLEKMRACGIRSVCITNNPAKRCGTTADSVLWTNTPAFDMNTPGLRSYFCNIIACLAIGCYAGICNGTLPEDSLETWGNAIKEYVHSWNEVIDDIDTQIYEVSKKWKDLWKLEYIGDGPEYFSAQFCEEKPVETAGYLATHVDSEDWCHINKFFYEPETIGTTFLIDKNSNMLSRELETLDAAIRLGRPTLVVTNMQDVSGIDKRADVCVIPECPEGFEWLMPLMDYMPAAIMSGYLCTLNGRRYFGAYDPVNSEWDKDLEDELMGKSTIGISQVEIHK